MAISNLFFERFNAVCNVLNGYRSGSKTFGVKSYMNWIVKDAVAVGLNRTKMHVNSFSEYSTKLSVENEDVDTDSSNGLAKLWTMSVL